MEVKQLPSPDGFDHRFDALRPQMRLCEAMRERRDSADFVEGIEEAERFKAEWAAQEEAATAISQAPQQFVAA